jgi:hypothetical protein
MNAAVDLATHAVQSDSSRTCWRQRCCCCRCTVRQHACNRVVTSGTHRLTRHQKWLCRSFLPFSAPPCRGRRGQPAAAAAWSRWSAATALLPRRCVHRGVRAGPAQASKALSALCATRACAAGARRRVSQRGGPARPLAGAAALPRVRRLLATAACSTHAAVLTNPLSAGRPARCARRRSRRARSCARRSAVRSWWCARWRRRRLRETSRLAVTSCARSRRARPPRATRRRASRAAR